MGQYITLTYVQLIDNKSSSSITALLACWADNSLLVPFALSQIHTFRSRNDIRLKFAWRHKGKFEMYSRETQ